MTMIENERILGEPVDRLQPKRAIQVPDHAVAGMHEAVLPDQRRDRRHDEEGRDDDDAQDALAPDGLVEQQREEGAADDGDDQHPAHQQQRIDQRGG
jgi:hypothetical protein